MAKTNESAIFQVEVSEQLRKDPEKWTLSAGWKGIGTSMAVPEIEVAMEADEASGALPAAGGGGVKKAQ